MKLAALDMDDYTALVNAARAADERLEIYPSCAFGFYFLPEPGDPSLTSPDFRSPSELLALGFDPRFVISAFVIGDAHPFEIGEISQLSPAAGKWLISVLDCVSGAETLAELLADGHEKAAAFVGAARGGIARAKAGAVLNEIEKTNARTTQHHQS